jgi:hypothetical protein
MTNDTTEPGPVPYADIRDGDTITATITGTAARSARHNGIYLRAAIGEAHNIGWACEPTAGEPVTFQRVTSVPHGAPRGLLIEGLNLIAEVDPDRAPEVAAAIEALDPENLL